MRSVPEWVGKTDDAAIPPRVKLRIFERAGGRCQECKRRIAGKLLPAYDHIKALVNGGEHRESNLQLLCTECHAIKTRQDVAEKATGYRKRLKVVGIKTKRRTIPGRKFDGTPIPARWVER